MSNSYDLARLLAADAPPRAPSAAPLIRAGGWLVLAAVVMGLLGLAQGVRPNFAERMQDVAFATSMVSSLLTGVLAAIAAFLISLPDRSRFSLLLPLPPLAVWQSTIGYQCFAGSVPVPPGAVTVEVAAGCVSTLVLMGLPLSLAMVFMLRHAVALRPAPVVFMGSLAVSAITAAALSMLHPMDATVMILGWNLGTAVLFLGIAAVLERRAVRR